LHIGFDVGKRVRDLLVLELIIFMDKITLENLELLFKP